MNFKIFCKVNPPPLYVFVDVLTEELLLPVLIILLSLEPGHIQYGMGAPQGYGPGGGGGWGGYGPG